MNRDHVKKGVTEAITVLAVPVDFRMEQRNLVISQWGSMESNWTYRRLEDDVRIITKSVLLGP